MIRAAAAIAIGVLTWIYGGAALWAYAFEDDLRVPLPMDALIININGYNSPPAVAVTFDGMPQGGITSFTLEVLSNERVDNATVDVTFAGDIARSFLQPPSIMKNAVCPDYGNFLPLTEDQLRDDEFTLLDGYLGDQPKRPITQMQVPILPDFHTEMIDNGRVFGSGLDLRCVFANDDIQQTSGSSISMKFPRVFVNRDHSPEVTADSRITYYPASVVAVMLRNSGSGTTLSDSSIPPATQSPPNPGDFPFTDLAFSKDSSRKTFAPVALYGGGSHRYGYLPSNRPQFGQPPYASLEFSGVGLLFSDPILASQQTRKITIATVVVGLGSAIALPLLPGVIPLVKRIFSHQKPKKSKP